MRYDGSLHQTLKGDRPLCMFPTVAKPDRLSPLPPADGPIPGRLGAGASDLLFDAKADPLRGLTRRPKQAGDSSILAPIPPNKPLGDRPLSEWNLHPIVDFGVIRHDPQGSGDFGAGRLHDKEHEPHGGVDIAVPVGTLVRAPADGRVATFDLGSGLTGIQITTSDERILKVLYVVPDNGIVSGAYVRAGQQIGRSQSLQKKYRPNAVGKMTDHVHFQVERRPRTDPKSPFLADPTEIVRQWFYSPKY